MPPRRKLTPKGYTPSPWMARRLAAQKAATRITKVFVNGKQVWPRLVDAPVKDLGDAPRLVRQYGPEISFTPNLGAFVLSANIPPSDAAPVGETTRESLSRIKAERAAKQAHEDALNAPLTTGALIALLSPQTEGAPTPSQTDQQLQAALRQFITAMASDLQRRRHPAFTADFAQNVTQAVRRGSGASPSPDPSGDLPAEARAPSAHPDPASR